MSSDLFVLGKGVHERARGGECQHPVCGQASDVILEAVTYVTPSQIIINRGPRGTLHFGVRQNKDKYSLTATMPKRLTWNTEKKKENYVRGPMRSFTTFLLHWKVVHQRTSKDNRGGKKCHTVVLYNIQPNTSSCRQDTMQNIDITKQSTQKHFLNLIRGNSQSFGSYVVRVQTFPD